MSPKHRSPNKYRSLIFYLLIGLVGFVVGTIVPFNFSEITSLMGAATITSVEIGTADGESQIVDSKSPLFKNIQSRIDNQINKPLTNQNQRAGWHDGEIPIPCSRDNVLFWTRVPHSYWDNNGYHHGFTTTYFYSDGSSCAEIWDSNNFFGINKSLIYSDAGSTSIGRVEGSSN